jgi:hypothetical protein
LALRTRPRIVSITDRKEDGVHPRIVVFAAVGVTIDLLCLAAAGVLLLTNNLWLQQVGAARFGLVTFVIGVGLVPILYGRERMIVAQLVEQLPKRKPRPVPAFARMDGSVHVA